MKRRRHRSLRILVVFVVSALVSLGVFAAQPAWAAEWHNYSLAYEKTSGGFTGLRAYRTDVHVGDQPSTGCSAPYTGVPVYQSQWVESTDYKRWMELGTGHQCNDTYRYWYWGYGVGGTWYPLGHHAGISDGDAHTFKISRDFDGTQNRYFWVIDGNQKANLISSDAFGQDIAGLESYAAPPTYVNDYTISSLQAQRNGGSFVDWSGKDDTWVSNSAMCGKWVSATAWQAAESNPCV